MDPMNRRRFVAVYGSLLTMPALGVLWPMPVSARKPHKKKCKADVDLDERVIEAELRAALNDLAGQVGALQALTQAHLSPFDPTGSLNARYTRLLGSIQLIANLMPELFVKKLTFGEADVVAQIRGHAEAIDHLTVAAGEQLDALLAAHGGELSPDQVAQLQAGMEAVEAADVRLLIIVLIVIVALAILAFIAIFGWKAEVAWAKVDRSVVQDMRTLEADFLEAARRFQRETEIDDKQMREVADCFDKKAKEAEDLGDDDLARRRRAMAEAFRNAAAED